jgi:hypothetical protein
VEKLPTVFASLSQREERANSQAMMSCEVGKSDGVPKETNNVNAKLSDEFL